MQFRRLFAPLAAITAALALGACTNLTSPSSSPTKSTMSSAQRQALDDWRIRAGLYEANEKPSALAYVPDSGLGTWSSACRTQQEKLAAYRPGLLKAPDAALASAVRRFDRAVGSLLSACIHNDPVGLHHAEGAMGVAASDVNVRYARLLGQDPSAWNAPRAL